MKNTKSNPDLYLWRKKDLIPFLINEIKEYDFDGNGISFTIKATTVTTGYFAVYKVYKKILEIESKELARPSYNNLTIKRVSKDLLLSIRALLIQKRVFPNQAKIVSKKKIKSRGAQQRLARKKFKT